MARGRRAPLDEAESAGVGGQGGGAGGVVEPLRVLGDAGLVLRDLSAMHLLSAQALALLQVGRGARSEGRGEGRRAGALRGMGEAGGLCKLLFQQIKRFRRGDWVSRSALRQEATRSPLSCAF